MNSQLRPRIEMLCEKLKWAGLLGWYYGTPDDAMAQLKGTSSANPRMAFARLLPTGGKFLCGIIKVGNGRVLTILSLLPTLVASTFKHEPSKYFEK